MNKSIIVKGKQYNIGTRTITWEEGLNGYDTSRYITEINNRRTGKTERIIVEGKRYSSRGFNKVSQFFLHHSGLYTAKDTFHVLHNQRRLSCHFILDDSGILYQTLDLKEKAWHGGQNNSISVGLEIASRANATKRPDAYSPANCKRYNVLPRKKKIDCINGQWIWGYEYNDKQYETIIRLSIALIDIYSLNPEFPFALGANRKTLKYPKKHNGLICHYHNSIQKIDPIALDYKRIINGIKNKNPYEPSTFKELTISEQQIFLSMKNLYTGRVDGICGPKTKAAIQKFQRIQRLSPDGIWGPKTNHMATEGI